MKPYGFCAEMEPDEEGWFVRCPTMERYGGAAWGETKAQAWKGIEEVLGLIVESMLELGMPVPEDHEQEDAPGENQAFIIVQPKQEPLSRKDYSPITYKFQVVVEPDEDHWFASCPTLEGRGAATWGKTYEAALIGIHQVLRMTLEGMIAHSEPIPVETPALPADTIAVTL